MMFGKDRTGRLGPSGELAAGELAEATGLRSRLYTSAARSPAGCSAARPGLWRPGSQEVGSGKSRSACTGERCSGSPGSTATASGSWRRPSPARGAYGVGISPVGDEDVTHVSVSARQRLGLGYVTDDRLGRGWWRRYRYRSTCYSSASASSLLESGPAHVSCLHQKAAESLAEEFDIRAVDVNAPGGTLSGATSRKCSLPASCPFSPKVVRSTTSPPTGWISRPPWPSAGGSGSWRRNGGVAAVLISTDLDELRHSAIASGDVPGAARDRGECRSRVEEQVGRSCSAARGVGLGGGAVA